MNKIVLSAATLVALFATPVFAADLGVINQPAPVGFDAPTRDWTGFYAGVFGGVSTGPFEWNAVPAGGGPVIPFNFNGGGGLAGVQIGADYQFNQFVIGAVADIAVTNQNFDVNFGGLGAGDMSSTLKYLGTVRARAGFAFDNILAYVHGGIAFGRTEVSGITLFPGGVISSPDRLGYTVGAGVEYAITDNISLQTEYAYTHFDDEQIMDLGAGAGVINENLAFHTVKAGLNFRF